MLLELRSTRLVLHLLSPLDACFVAHHFNGLITDHCDPELVHKSPRAPPVLERQPAPKRRPHASLTKLFMKLTVRPPGPLRSQKRRAHGTAATAAGTAEAGFADYSSFRLDRLHALDEKCVRTLHLLNRKPNLNNLFKPDQEEAKALWDMTTGVYMSWSLQELVSFGSAIDHHEKPFVLRLTFPNQQCLLATFNGYQLVALFYKMNVGRELSFDIESRSLEPLDYCLPRRRRTRRGSRRRRTNTVSSLASSVAEDDTEADADADAYPEEEDPPPYTLALQTVSEGTAERASQNFCELTQSLSGNHPSGLHAVAPWTSRIPIARPLVTAAALNAEIRGTMPTESTLSITRTASLFSSGDQMSRVTTIDSAFTLALPKLPLDPPSTPYGNLIFALKCVKACRPKKVWLETSNARA